MPYSKPTSSDSRGWRPKEGETNPEIKESRTGENKTPRKVIDVKYPTGEAREAEKAVKMDNMGNSPLINIKVGDSKMGGTVREMAENVDNAPSVPLSSYDGVESAGAGGGISLEDGFRAQIADREIRAKVDHAPKSGAIVEGDVTSANAAFNKATIPGGFESIKESQFTGDGSNPSNVESKVMGDKTAPKFEGEFTKSKNKLS